MGFWENLESGSQKLGEHMNKKWHETSRNIAGKLSDSELLFCLEKKEREGDFIAVEELSKEARRRHLDY